VRVAVPPDCDSDARRKLDRSRAATVSAGDVDEGRMEDVRKARWDLPEDATPEAIEHDRKVSWLVASGWMHGANGRWIRPSFVVGTRPRGYPLDEAYALARAEAGK